ncbi:MAG: hypothetical protein JXB36_08860 [Gammaproteobacteria bacterium]|nr:hypothetical protein [Gammaproteobacteria bacterium]
MRKPLFVSLAAAMLAVSAGASAHHSFAIYDMQTSVEFEGIVETLKFRNPHMAMTLKAEVDGEEKIINFVEGAPANMLVRMGFDPAVIQPGQRIKVVGSPRKDDPDAYFLKTIITEDGQRYQVLN